MLAKWCRSYLSFIFNLWNIMLNHQKTIRWVVFLCTYVPFQTCDSLESLFVDTLTYLTIHFVVEPNQQYWGNGCVSVCVRLCTCFTCANTKKPIAHNIYHLATPFSVQCPLYKTNIRAGILNTTGQSTNYILHVSVRFPVSFWPSCS